MKTVIGLEAHNPLLDDARACAASPCFYAWLGWYRYGFTKSRGAQGER